MAENPMLHINLMARCSTEQELWPLEVVHCGNRDLTSRSRLESYKRLISVSSRSRAFTSRAHPWQLARAWRQYV